MDVVARVSGDAVLPGKRKPLGRSVCLSTLVEISGKDDTRRGSPLSCPLKATCLSLTHSHSAPSPTLRTAKHRVGEW